MAVLSKTRYMFILDDWRNRSVNIHDANEEIGRRSLLFGNVERGQASSKEEFNGELKARVSKLEKRHRVTSDKTLLDEDDPQTWTHVSPPNLTKRTDTEPLNETSTKGGEADPDQSDTEENRVQTHFEISANVDIASQDDTIGRKCKRTKKLQESVSSDRIRPQSPPEKLGETKSFELMDKVGAYHNDVLLKSIQFNLSDLRIPKEWVDGVWKIAKEGKAVVGKKRKATGPLVDNLAFLQRDEKRPIGPRNPPIPVTPEVILPIDPFVTPEFPRFSRLGHWMELQGIHCVLFYINKREKKKKKEFFQYMDDAENNLKEEEEHIDAAFAILNCKRVEQTTWFRNKNIPTACFVPVSFLEVVGYNYKSLKKPPKKGIKLLEGHVGEVVRGFIHPNKMWLEDGDVIYGVVHDRLNSHFIEMEIHLMDNTITLFHCGLPKENITVGLTQIQKLAVLIPAIKLEFLGEEINYKDIVPFQIKKAEELPKTKFPYNCGIFVVKMLECK
ncbi:hypothetical protein Bca4012_058523 [Brassica carinata]